MLVEFDLYLEASPDNIDGDLECNVIPSKLLRVGEFGDSISLLGAVDGGVCILSVRCCVVDSSTICKVC